MISILRWIVDTLANVRRAPPLNYTTHKCLFRIICYVRAESVEDLAIMAVTAPDDFWSLHSRTEGAEDARERSVKELASEFPELKAVSMLACCFEMEIKKNNVHGEEPQDLLLGMARKATTVTAFL